MTKRLHCQLSRSTIQELLSTCDSDVHEVQDEGPLIRMLLVYIGQNGQLSNESSFFPGIDNASATSTRNRTLNMNERELTVYNHHRIFDAQVLSKTDQHILFEVIHVRNAGLLVRNTELKSISQMVECGFQIAVSDIDSVLMNGGWVYPILPRGKTCYTWALRLYHLDRQLDLITSIIYETLDAIFSESYNVSTIITFARVVCDYLDEGTLLACPDFLLKRRLIKRGR